MFELESAVLKETNPIARDIISALIQNAEIAKIECIPLCQDTGSLIVFVELGNEVFISGDPLPQIINSALVEASHNLCLRPSICSDPLFDRTNTKDNSPSIIHLSIVAGDKIKISLAQKGGGAENMSVVRMFDPAAGKAELIDLVYDTVLGAGGNSCPPLIIGIGMGGNFELAPLLAKKALLSPLSLHHPDPRYALLEKEILHKVNQSGVGPQGLGGDTTALAVHILHAPCHIASLPLAINLQCHAHRHASFYL